jgi:nitronate monooxygenase
VEGSGGTESLVQHFAPRDFITGDLPALVRPDFFAIVSSDIVAKTLSRKASGTVDGFVVEYHTAGGHNAPPRRSRGDGSALARQAYGEIDLPDIAKILELGKPFWLGGGYASPEAIAAAKAQGATGVQIGTAFALCEESGIDPEIRRSMIHNCLAGMLSVRTDFEASPTGYPFKLASFDKAEPLPDRCRICDLGYLRRPWRTEDGRIAYRCPGEPIDKYLAKGGSAEETVGRQCLCNGLLATIGLAQVRNGILEPPMLTMGEDLSFLRQVLKGGQQSYTASELIDYLDGKAPSASSSGIAS